MEFECQVELTLPLPSTQLPTAEEPKKPLTPRSVVNITTWSHSQPPLDSARELSEDTTAGAATEEVTESAAEDRRWKAWRAMSGAGILLLGTCSHTELPNRGSDHSCFLCQVHASNCTYRAREV